MLFQPAARAFCASPVGRRGGGQGVGAAHQRPRGGSVAARREAECRHAMGTHHGSRWQAVGRRWLTTQQPQRQRGARQRGLQRRLTRFMLLQRRGDGLHRVGIGEVADQHVLGELREGTGLRRLGSQQRQAARQALRHAGGVAGVVVPGLVDEICDRGGGCLRPCALPVLQSLQPRAGSDSAFTATLRNSL